MSTSEKVRARSELGMSTEELWGYGCQLTKEVCTVVSAETRYLGMSAEKRWIWDVNRKQMGSRCRQNRAGLGTSTIKMV